MLWLHSYFFKNNNVNKADNDNYETKAPTHAMVA